MIGHSEDGKKKERKAERRRASSVVQLRVNWQLNMVGCPSRIALMLHMYHLVVVAPVLLYTSR